MAKIKLIVRKMSFLAIASSFLLISCNRNNEIHTDEIKTIIKNRLKKLEETGK